MVDGGPVSHQWKTSFLPLRKRLHVIIQLPIMCSKFWIERNQSKNQFGCFLLGQTIKTTLLTFPYRTAIALILVTYVNTLIIVNIELNWRHSLGASRWSEGNLARQGMMGDWVARQILTIWLGHDDLSKQKSTHLSRNLEQEPIYKRNSTSFLNDKGGGKLFELTSS